MAVSKRCIHSQTVVCLHPQRREPPVSTKSSSLNETFERDESLRRIHKRTAAARTATLSSVCPSPLAPKCSTSNVWAAAQTASAKNKQTFDMLLGNSEKPEQLLATESRGSLKGTANGGEQRDANLEFVIVFSLISEMSVM